MLNIYETSMLNEQDRLITGNIRDLTYIKGEVKYTGFTESEISFMLNHLSTGLMYLLSCYQLLHCFFICL